MSNASISSFGVKISKRKKFKVPKWFSPPPWTGHKGGLGMTISEGWDYGGLWWSLFSLCSSERLEEGEM